jgi:hypothetical protein
VGATVNLTASMREYDVPLQRLANVWAEIQRPDGFSEHLVLSPDSGRTQFISTYNLLMQGLFRIRVRARGETMQGTPFERERTLTAVTIRGGDLWSPNDPKTNDLCELIICLKKSELVSSDLGRKLKDLGIDLHSFLKCLDGLCSSTTDELEKRRPQKYSSSAET